MCVYFVGYTAWPSFPFSFSLAVNQPLTTKIFVSWASWKLCRPVHVVKSFHPVKSYICSLNAKSHPKTIISKRLWTTGFLLSSACSFLNSVFMVVFLIMEVFSKILSILLRSLLSVILEFAGVCETAVSHFATPVENLGARTPGSGNSCQAPCVK